MKRAMRTAGIFLAVIFAAFLGYYAGGRSVKSAVQETFYASITEIKPQYIAVQGLDINDINKRWKFDLLISGDTELAWRGVPISINDLRAGDIISITYTGLVKETSPALIDEVLRIQALGDDLEERDIHQQ